MTNLKKLANFFKMRYPDVAPLTVRLNGTMSRRFIHFSDLKKLFSY